MSPGNTVRPCRSIIFVFAARIGTMALSAPMASTRSPLTATACAIENLRSTVTILPLYRITSGPAAISADENKMAGRIFVKMGVILLRRGSALSAASWSLDIFGQKTVVKGIVLCFTNDDETQGGDPAARKVGCRASSGYRNRSRFPVAPHDPSQEGLPKVCSGRGPSGLGVNGRVCGWCNQAVQYSPGNERSSGTLAAKLSGIEGEAGRDLRSEPRLDP